MDVSIYSSVVVSVDEGGPDSLSIGAAKLQKGLWSADRPNPTNLLLSPSADPDSRAIGATLWILLLHAAKVLRMELYRLAVGLARRCGGKPHCKMGLPVLLGCLLLAAQLSCTPTKQPKEQTESVAVENARKTIYVVNYPLQYFARRIAGEKADIVFPAQDVGDPAYWSPPDKIVLAYQKADLILLNGAGYAKWVRTVSLPESKIVNTSAGFKEQYIMLEDAVVHSHGPEGDHAHEGIDFNTWLDPQLAIVQARAVQESLAELMPVHAAALEQNFKALERDLQGLDAGLKDVAAGYQKQPLLASHPVYNYLARHGGWNLKSVHWEPDQMPDDEQWKKLQELLRRHPAKWMIWEDRPAEKIAEKLKQLGVDSVVFCTCGGVPEQGDYLEVMQQNIKRLNRFSDKTSRFTCGETFIRVFGHTHSQPAFAIPVQRGFGSHATKGVPNS